jgi:hypothetical protein
VALDQNTTASAPETTRGAAIENEIPAYRAIGPGAVVSLVFGALSLLSLIDSTFLSCSALAIVLGVLADRKIQRLPDVLAGRKLAQAGIALGLVFGLASITSGTVQHYLRRVAAARFARSYVEVLKTGQLEDVYWYTKVPERRKDKAPTDLFKETQTRTHDPFGLETQIGALKDLKTRLDHSGQEARFTRIEEQGGEGVIAFATALLEVDGPPTKAFPEREQFALLTLKSDTRKSKYEWWVDEVRFPYKPRSYVPTPKPVDDRHGHGHAR